MSSWSANTFNKEAASLAAVISRTGGDFTIGEAEHWSNRLTAAYEADQNTWRNA